MDQKIEIWLVEDDLATRKMVSHFLTKKIGDYHVRSFEYAEDVLTQAELEIPDLIIFDNILKGEITGIEAAETLKGSQQIPTLLYSATPNQELLNRCIQLEMTRYLSKPINPIELEFNIRSLLRENRNKAKLEKLNTKYHALFNKSEDMIFISDPTGTFADINPSGLKMLGFKDKRSFLERAPKEHIFVRNGDLERFVKEMSEAGFVKDFRTICKTMDHRQLDVVITSSSILKDRENPDGLFIGILRDITQHIETERNLIQMNSKQIAINEKLRKTQLFMVQQEKMASLGGLAAGIAHEINNPLGFVMSNFRSLQKYLDKIKEYLSFTESVAIDIIKKKQAESETVDSQHFFSRKKKIDFILEDVIELFEESTEGFERISSIIENMQQFSRVDNENKRSMINLNDAIKNTLVIARNSYKYVANVETDLKDIPYISCNRNEINQVLLNIIVNAAQAIEQCSREGKGLIQIRTYAEDDSVSCEISDNGNGIPQEQLSKIFDPFFTTKVVGKGTGMGLTISFDIIVNKHGGELSVQSKAGEGTTFHIRLRADRDSEPAMDADPVKDYDHQVTESENANGSAKE